MAESTTNYLGRCKDCDYALFATPQDIRQGDNALAGGPAVDVGNGQIMGRCTNGHRWFPLKAVKGTFSAEHQCDSRCLNAKGHSCTCSCGGANHGRGHAVAVVEASNIASVPTPKLDAGFLGEVDKHIVGEVTVKSTRDINNDKTLYTFVTDAGHVVKWFAPSFANPQWARGERHKIRAKVRKHEDHPDFGKSTLVTYVEEKE
jgi:hypothetical protein